MKDVPNQYRSPTHPAIGSNRNGPTHRRLLRELVALDWDHVDLDAEPAELHLPGALQKGTKRDAYLDLSPATARQLWRYRLST